MEWDSGEEIAAPALGVNSSEGAARVGRLVTCIRSFADSGLGGLGDAEAENNQQLMTGISSPVKS